MRHKNEHNKAIESRQMTTSNANTNHYPNHSNYPNYLNGSNCSVPNANANQFGSGKVILAAIVHGERSLAKANKASGPLEQTTDRASGGQPGHLLAHGDQSISAARDTHAASQARASLSTSFARFLWSKKKAKKGANNNKFTENCGDEEKEGKASIRLQAGNNQTSDWRPSKGRKKEDKEEEEEEEETTFSPAARHLSDVTLTSGRLSPDGHHQPWTSAATATNSSSGSLKASRGRPDEQVIEFKFDLIVDEHREHLELGQANDRMVAAANRQVDLAKQQRKLLDNVNELVESFVLDSNDACLMSIGSASGQHPTSGHKDHNEFDYICQLAQRALTYSFELIQVSSQMSGRRARTQLMGHLLQADVNDPRGSLETGDEGGEEDQYCIELGVVLFKQRFLAAHEQQDEDEQRTSVDSEWFEIVDLLEEEEEEENDDDFKLESSWWSASVASTVECRSLQEALIKLQLIKARLCKQAASGHHKNLLSINLKLKQTVAHEELASRQQEGSSFTNRLTLIHFDPNFNELQCIFESIFNGQPLAHLRRRKVHLSSLMGSLGQASKLAGGPTSGRQASTQDNCTHTHSKQHHQVASLQKLIQAEWFLYKQLSSALIKTLLVVHVHKLTCASGRKDDLMQYNLNVLHFARLIKRASSSRLKRRKRHLKRHHLSRLSLTSGQTSSNQNLSLNNSQLYLAPSSCVHSASRRTRRAASSGRDLQLMLADDYGGANRRRLGHCHTHDQRHRRRQQPALDNRHRQDSFSEQFSETTTTTSPSIGLMEQRSISRQMRRRRRQSEELTELESSSMSTASESCRLQQLQQVAGLGGRLSASGRAAHHKLAGLRQAPGGHLSDTDSVTSHLASNCSSASMFNQQMLASHSTSPSRRHLELKWLAKSVQQRAVAPPPPEADDHDQEVAEIVNRLDRKQQPTLQQQPDLSDDDDDLNSLSGQVAEPPKQLKLEEFLTQLTSIIAPARLQTGQQQPVEASMQLGSCNDELDEDCKSHSSILDHLSLLALESSSKLQRQTATPNGGQPPTGHLQRILNDETSQHRFGGPPKTISQQQTTASVEDRLRALSIDCAHESPTSPTNTNSGASTATFGSSSMDSAFASSSSSSSNRSGQPATGPASKQLYSSVMKTQQMT